MNNNNAKNGLQSSQNNVGNTNSRMLIRSLKAEANKKRKISEKLADGMTKAFGSMTFQILNILWFAAWIVVNLGWVPGIAVFDPFPFGLLTMIVSLEAILLAIFVLISQNRASKVDDLREEIDLQVDIITEKELTKLMRMVNLLLEKNGIDTAKDEELQEMLKPINMQKIKKSLEKQTDE